MPDRLPIRFKLLHVDETSHGPEHVTLCLGCLSAGYWTPRGGWRLGREAELVLDGLLDHLTALARQVWREMLAENQCRFPNWEGRRVTTLSVVDGELRLDTPGCPEQPGMSLEEVTEAFIRWGNTPDGWGKALRFFVGELTRETSGA